MTIIVKLVALCDVATLRSSQDFPEGMTGSLRFGLIASA
jgi:hypothetical protein